MVEVFTLGCRLNQYDSARLKALLNDYKEDLIVLNTCCVTSKAQSDARKMVRKFRREYPSTKIAVIGCSVKYSKNKLRDFLEADFVVENEKELLKEIGLSLKDVVTPDFGKRTRPFLKIQEGCDRKCSYCVVPFVRGKSTSRELLDIEKEFDSLLAKKFKEIVLTGTNISDYGKDLGKGLNLKILLKTLVRKDGDFRIRLSSVEPSIIDEEFIEIIKESGEKICRHIHIPIQSMSPKVLKDMNRDQNVEKLKDNIEKLFISFPDIGIGCDILVAYPTEGEREFEETYNFLKILPISFFHVFTYSRRENTPSFSLKPLSKEVCRERSKLILELGKMKKYQFLKRNEKKIVKSIILSGNTALSSNFIEFKIESKYEPNNFVEFKLKLNSTGEPYGIEVV